MRIGMITEGTYPMATGGVSTWCHQLVSGMPEHEWHLHALVGSDAETVWPLPDQVASVTTTPVWAPIVPLPMRRLRDLARRRRAVADALHAFWAAALPPVHQVDALTTGRGQDCIRVRQAEAALRTLAEPGPVPLAAILDGSGSTEAILAVWQRHRANCEGLGPLSAANAAMAASLVDRTLAVLGKPWREVDVVHATANGPSALIALAASWNYGIPFVLTEHGVYLRERYLALGATSLSWPVRYVVMAALKRICGVAYEQAVGIYPVSSFNSRWANQFGASPHKTLTIPNGVDEAAYVPAENEPEVPTVTFVGRIDPLKDLETLVRAFAIVVPKVPGVRLRLFGPCPSGNEAYQAKVDALIRELNLAGSATWEGPVDRSPVAIAAGHVVALSSISEGLPFSVIESMLCGRATVCTDVGGVPEIIGRDGRCGSLVAPRDPAAMAAALTDLLVDDERRHRVAQEARAYALERFRLSQCIDAYRRVYDHAALVSAERSLGLAGPSVWLTPAEEAASPPGSRSHHADPVGAAS